MKLEIVRLRCNNMKKANKYWLKDKINKFCELGVV